MMNQKPKMKVKAKQQKQQPEKKAECLQRYFGGTWTADRERAYQTWTSLERQSLERGIPFLLEPLPYARRRKCDPEDTAEIEKQYEELAKQAATDKTQWTR